MLVALLVGVCGVALGLLWLWLSPRVPMVSDGQAVYLKDTEGEEAVGGDGTFVVIALILGALTAAAVFWRFRKGGVAVVLGLALGGLIASVVGWRLGVALGPTSDIVAHAKAGRPEGRLRRAARPARQERDRRLAGRRDGGPPRADVRLRHQGRAGDGAAPAGPAPGRPGQARTPAGAAPVGPERVPEPAVRPSYLRASSAVAAEASSARAAGATSSSRPRLPAETKTVPKASAEASSTVGSALRWPSGEMPPRT